MVNNPILHGASATPNTPDRHLSKATGDILKAIYVAQSTSAPLESAVTASSARATAPSFIADRTGTSRAFVTKMLQTLHKQGLVEYAPYKGVRLTETGTKSAVELLRHHRLLERFLTDILQFSPGDAHIEAERLEHVISEAFEARLAAFLDHPTTCPHGAPIPNADGSLPILESSRP